MIPTNFKESNKILSKPENMTDDECISLPVFNDGEICISCWKASFIERLIFIITGKIFIGILSGHTQPPIWAAIKKPFVKVNKEKP